MKNDIKILRKLYRKLFLYKFIILMVSCSITAILLSNYWYNSIPEEYSFSSPFTRTMAHVLLTFLLLLLLVSIGHLFISIRVEKLLHNELLCLLSPDTISKLKTFILEKIGKDYIEEGDLMEFINKLEYEYLCKRM